MTGCEPTNPSSSDDKEADKIATIYGPVGWITQEPGKPAQVRLQKQWQYLEGVMDAILAGKNSFIKTNGEVDCLTPGAELTADDIQRLSDVLSDFSGGELEAIPSLVAYAS